MNIQDKIRNVIRKNWSRAPNMATTDLLALYHKNPRLDSVRIIATKCASVELFLYDKKDPQIIDRLREVLEKMKEINQGSK